MIGSVGDPTTVKGPMLSPTCYSGSPCEEILVEDSYIHPERHILLYCQWSFPPIYDLTHSIKQIPLAMRHHSIRILCGRLQTMQRFINTLFYTYLIVQTRNPRHWLGQPLQLRKGPCRLLGSHKSTSLPTWPALQHASQGPLIPCSMPL